MATLRIDQAAPLLLMGAGISTIIFLQTFFKKTLKLWGFAFGSAKMNVDENLPFFFTSINLQHSDWLINENKVLKDNYGFELISKEVSNTLDTVGRPKKAIQGIPYYIILANPIYQRQFQYVCCDVQNREILIRDDKQEENSDNPCEQSDLTNLILNMAYMPDEVTSSLRFTQGFQKDYRAAMDEWLVNRGKAPTTSSRNGSLSKSLLSKSRDKKDQ
jgi:hypothetical protein